MKKKNTTSIRSSYIDVNEIELVHGLVAQRLNRSRLAI